MAFEKGNKLGASSRLFDGALKRAIAQDDGKRLRAAAEKLLDLASEGQPWALSMLADRLDGKSAQSISVEHSDLRTMPLENLKDAIAEAIAVAGGAGQPDGGEGQPNAVH